MASLPDTAPAGLTSAAPLADRSSLAWPLGALALLLVLQFTLVFTRAINWDEYSYFREVAWFAEGRLDRPLQTIHARLFAWLPGLFASSTDHIVAARVVMFGCELVTLASIFAVARRLGDARTAAFACLAYLSAGFVLQHGTSFRVDPLATALLSSALATLFLTRLRLPQIAAFGLLAGLAAMVSIKAVLFAPAFAGLALARLVEQGWHRDLLWRIAGCVVAALVAFAALYLFHAAGVTAQEGAAARGSGVLASSGGWAFFLGVPPYWKMIGKALLTAPVMTAIILITPVLLWRQTMPLPRKLALAGLWLPIASLAFYTNTAAYFYAFIFAPVAMAAGPVLGLALGRYGARTVALVLLLVGGGLWLQEDRAMIDRQRQLEANVAEVFPAPVTYFDHNYMLGGWPKANNLMTPWGLDNYHRRGEPAYKQAMEQQVVPLFLANYPDLDDMITGRADGLLLPEDEAALRGNYVLHSWPIWVAGKDFAGRSGSFQEHFLVPGTYTVHGSGLTLGGRLLADGETVDIVRGDHAVALAPGAQVRLVWGDHLPLPATPLVPGPLYTEF